MSKVDIIVMSILATIMALFFWLGTKWSFFCAGVCAAVVFFISIGFLLRGMEYGERSKEWDRFLKKLDKNETILESSTPDASL